MPISYGVTLHLGHSTLDLHNIYKPPDVNSLELGELLAHAASSPTFIGGDFNCHHPILHYPGRTNSAGRQLETALTGNPGVALLNNGEPTHLHGGRLDLSFVTDILRPCASWALHPTLTSDHFAIICHLNLPEFPSPQLPAPRWNTKLANWAKTFHAAASESIPLTSSSTTKPPRDYWFYNDRVRELNSRITFTRRLYRRKPTAQNRALLQVVVSAANRRKADIRREHWLNWCRGLDSHSSLGEMWRQLQVIAGNKRPIRPPHPDPAREAEKLASLFATRTCTDNLPAETRDRLTELLPGRNDQVDRACEDQSNTNTSLTLLELRRALKTSGDTSPGADRTTYSMITNAGSDGHSALLTLFNASWEACKLP
ncbi:hypothetical protein GWK47_048625 [Chionoecetes opilio]|uniref:Endonuclease/exonuclease/phosphatase domain-containing protein n=1 Tax=Chionoecetes opilio TaxID=41210 RepID=A0A8J5CTZ3_CHIOP|nr:hypothetical protein GWK47_048625 [Chionoecetes opilio]